MENVQNKGSRGSLRNVWCPGGGGAGHKGGTFNVQGEWHPCPFYQIYDGMVPFKESLIIGPLSPWYHFTDETNFVNL